MNGGHVCPPFSSHSSPTLVQVGLTLLLGKFLILTDFSVSLSLSLLLLTASHSLGSSFCSRNDGDDGNDDGDDFGDVYYYYYYYYDDDDDDDDDENE